MDCLHEHHSQAPMEYPIEFTSFRGSPDDNVYAFVQHVQRIAFAYDKQDDDHWRAGYAEAAFKDDALEWFIDLSPEVQGSWIELRRALIRNYKPGRLPASPQTIYTDTQVLSPIPQSSIDTRIGLEPLTMAAPMPALATPPQPAAVLIQSSTDPRGGMTTAAPVPAPARKRTPIIERASSRAEARDIRQGKIMMIDSEHAQPLGYICKHKPRNLLTMKVEDALVVDLPNSRAEVEPFHLRMSNCQSGDPIHSYLGLYLESYQKQNTLDGKDYWVLQVCSESGPDHIHKRRASVHEKADALASSAVWSVRCRPGRVEEIQMEWMENNGDSTKLRAVYMRDRETGLALPSMRRITEMPTHAAFRPATIIFQPI